MLATLQTLSRYHRWAYEILFVAIDQLTAADYFADLGLAFTSVHGTLNHLYLGDHLWYCRFTDTQHSFTSVKQISFPDYAQTREGLRQQAEQWCQFIDQLSMPLPQRFNRTNFKGVTKSSPYLPTLLHVFNHATHHRGQISVVLTQKNIAAPEMDLVYYLATLSK